MTYENLNVIYRKFWTSIINFEMLKNEMEILIDKISKVFFCRNKISKSIGFVNLKLYILKRLKLIMYIYN